jgi:exonuclease SbcC
MINDLRYAVTFPTNGVSLSGHLSLQPGATAITGDNGVGKSFIAEMIRYGLFGKKALRGPASDYKTLDMEQTFEVGGAEYRVARGKKEMLYDPDGEQVAVGADAVNKKIVDLLGFDLEVFDVVCAANQKESERLTKLTPARRKELIDDVVGLTRQETVEKACRDEANGLKREIEALTRTVVLPTEPVKPEGYRPSQTIKDELDETIALAAQRVKLQRVIDAVGEAPVEPDEELALSVDELEQHERDRVAQEAHRAAAERQLASIPTTTVTQEQIDQAEALAAYDADIARRGPRPEYTERELVNWEATWHKKNLLKHDQATCPQCQHQFVLDTPDVDVAAIEALPTPPITLKEIDVQIRRHDLWLNDPVEPEGERMSAQEIAIARNALLNEQRRVALQQELAALSPMEDKSEVLAWARRLDREWTIYEHASVQHMTRVAAAHEAQAELDKLATPKHAPEDLNHAYTEARIYEEKLTDYAIAKERFDELTALIAEKQERAEGFTAGAKGLVEARRTLKAFLAPSLSRVASKLIRDMTANSQRPLLDIVVDEDMNITADGQDVGTFNGAHATMINLALRLALGQVLVARVFPVFIGDEIDSDADAGNSQAIADALMSCREQLKQIVLISHKRLENMDHEVML